MQTNFRRELKNLWKNFQRGDIDSYEVKGWLQERGLVGYAAEIQDILRSKTPGRIFSRLGRAALKEGKLVALCSVAGGYRYERTGSSWVKVWETPEDYRTVPFLIPAIQQVITVRENEGYINEKGEFTHFCF